VSTKSLAAECGAEREAAEAAEREEEEEEEEGRAAIERNSVLRRVTDGAWL
jgi:hypothetical protein